jgi:phosphorylase/glycogen(starch) synthase
MTYYEALAGCDLGVFPSYYEPWGYTPLESAAHAIPTITTDQAGFGLWAQQAAGECGGIILLKHLGQPIEAITDNLHGIFRTFLAMREEEVPAGRTGRSSTGATRRRTAAPSRPPWPARRRSPPRTSRRS